MKLLERAWRLTVVRRSILSLFFTGFLLAACAGAPGEAGLPDLELFEQPVADAPDPAERAGAAAEHIECTHGIVNGGWSEDFGYSGNASHPDRALAQFLEMNLFGIPDDGYAPTGRDTDRRLYTYSVDDQPKVAIIVVDAGGTGEGWTVETYATCDAAEYDPSADDQLSVDIWLDSEGNRVLTSKVSSRRGAEHCGWESVTFLTFDGRQYIGDPGGVLSNIVWYEGDATIPPDATDTGYHHDGRHLWISADGDVAYVADNDDVEAWPAPSTTDPVACA